MLGIVLLLILLVLFSGCHCPSPVGFCAHDLAYLLPATPFLIMLKLRVTNFHWWRHKKCAHHIKGTECKGHDHVPKTVLALKLTDKGALKCEGKSETEEARLNRLYERIYDEDLL